MTEPRLTLKTWFNSGAGTKVVAANMKRRDDADAKYEADYELSETDLKFLFETKALDVVFVVTTIRVEPIVRGGLTFGYRHFLGVQPTTILKYNSGGALVVGPEMLDKALEEVRRIVRTNTLSGSVITPEPERQETKRLGSTVLYGSTCSVRYEQYV